LAKLCYFVGAAFFLKSAFRIRAPVLQVGYSGLCFGDAFVYSKTAIVFECDWTVENLPFRESLHYGHSQLCVAFGALMLSNSTHFSIT
jgi:hypothetical protein